MYILNIYPYIRTLFSKAKGITFAAAGKVLVPPKVGFYKHLQKNIIARFIFHNKARCYLFQPVSYPMTPGTGRHGWRPWWGRGGNGWKCGNFEEGSRGARGWHSKLGIFGILLQGCRFVPYTFSETISHWSVPTYILNIAFHGFGFDSGPNLQPCGRDSRWEYPPLMDSFSHIWDVFSQKCTLELL